MSFISRYAPLLLIAGLGCGEQGTTVKEDTSPKPIPTAKAEVDPVVLAQAPKAKAEPEKAEPPKVSKNPVIPADERDINFVTNHPLGKALKALDLKIDLETGYPDLSKEDLDKIKSVIENYFKSVNRELTLTGAISFRGGVANNNSNPSKGMTFFTMGKGSANVAETIPESLVRTLLEPSAQRALQKGISNQDLQEKIARAAIGPNGDIKELTEKLAKPLSEADAKALAAKIPTDLLKQAFIPAEFKEDIEGFQKYLASKEFLGDYAFSQNMLRLYYKNTGDARTSGFQIRFNYNGSIDINGEGASFTTDYAHGLIKGSETTLMQTGVKPSLYKTGANSSLRVIPSGDAVFTKF